MRAQKMAEMTEKDNSRLLHAGEVSKAQLSQAQQEVLNLRQKIVLAKQDALDLSLEQAPPPRGPPLADLPDGGVHRGYTLAQWADYCGRLERAYSALKENALISRRRSTARSRAPGRTASRKRTSQTADSMATAKEGDYSQAQWQDWCNHLQRRLDASEASVKDLQALLSAKATGSTGEAPQSPSS